MTGGTPTGEATAVAGPLASPGYWLHQAALAWRLELERALRPLELTTTQFILLGSVGWLTREGAAPTQQEVAAMAGADRMMTSKVLRVLADRGLLVRVRDDADARAVRVRLTADGRRLTNRATHAARRVDADTFGSDAAAIRAQLRGVAERRAPS